MKLLAKVVSGIGLVLTIGPSLLVFNNTMSLDTAKTFMMVGTILWFLAASVWMNKKVAAEEQ